MVWKPPRFMVITSGIGVFVGGCVLLKDSIVGRAQRMEDSIRADGKVVIVTGANTGIGKETVRELAKRGAVVYMACRDLSKCQKSRNEIALETNNNQLYCRACDLSDFDSIHSFVREFRETERKCHVLVNNAGVMRCPRSTTKQGIETQLGVNHMGHFLLTNLLLDLLKEGAPSRVVNVSSIAHTRGAINFQDLNSDLKYDSSDAYNQSKLANVLFSRELAKRLEGTGVTSNACHPGLVNTEIGRHMGLQNSMFASVFVKPVLSIFLKSPEQGALTPLYLTLHPSLNGVTGKYFSDCKEVSVSKEGEDESVAKKLWVTSERWTRLTPATSVNH